MSQENVERLRAGFESFLAGRSDFGVELLDPEVEWDATDSGVRRFWREWLSSWETVSFGKYAHLYTFRDGLIVHWKGYRNQTDALEAVGLRG
jgi:ketosteroid isomerase-like protein